MPQAVPALIAFGSSALGSAILSFAFTTLVGSLFSKKGPETTDPKNYGFQVNAQSSKQPMPLIYGRTRAGINRSFVETSGSGNEYIHIIGLLGEGEIEGFSEQVSGVNPVYLNNKLYTEFGASNVHFELFTGTSTQTVCSTLATAVPAWTDPLRNTAYIYVRLKFDRDKFQGIPDITVGIKGLKVYDPTADTTAYSNNPALCVYDMLTRQAYRGGYGLARARIDTVSTEAARQYCEDYGWTCNMPITENQAISDNIQLLLNNFRGELLSSGGKYHLRFRDLNEESVVESFSDQADRDIVAGSFKITDPDVFTAYTAVRVNYMAEDGATDGTSTYKEKSFVLPLPGLTEGDGTYNEFSIRCLGLSDLDTVQKMANYFLERFQLNKRCNFIAGQKATRLEPMDLISVTHTMPGWSAKIFRVLNPVINPDFTVTLECIEENSEFYDGVFDPTVLEWYDTTLPDINAGPSSVINVSLEEVVYYYRNRSFTRLKCNFDKPSESVDPFWDYAEVYLKIGSGDYKYMTRSEGDWQLDPVEEGETYYIKLRSVSIQGVRQAEDAAFVVSKTIDGKTILPTSLASMTAVANGDSVSIFATPINDPDVEGYEVRLGPAWDGAIFISFNKNCSLRLNGVRPGTHTFWMSPRDNAGKYSETPVSATVRVFIPPGYTQLPTYGSWSWNFTAGTHDNTESVTHNSQDALKCSHTAKTLDVTLSSGITQTGSIFEKTGASVAWDEQVYSNTGYAGGARVSFTPSQSNKRFMIGLDTNPSQDASYVNIDYALYALNTGALHAYESGVPTANIGTYVSGDILEVVYTGTQILYKKNGTTLRQVTVSITDPLYLDSCFYDQGAKASNIQFSEYPIVEGLLSGTFTSPTYDLNAVEKVRVWGDFLTDFISSDTTWDGVAPAGTTWEDLGSGSWAEIFEPTQAGRVEAVLKYSTDNTNWSSISFFQVICAEVEARYIKVEITITDPTLDSNLYLYELNMVAYEGPQGA